jgi:hypothetical protein
MKHTTPHALTFQIKSLGVITEMLSKTRRRTQTTSRSQTRKRTVLSSPSPSLSTKKIIPISKDYIPTDQESEVPIPVYEPLMLPTHKESITSVLMCYKLTQSETKDTFIAKVERHSAHTIEIAVGGSVRSLPRECVNINISSTRISNTKRVVEAILNVDYNERCNTEKNLKSALILARVAISFAYTYFKIDKFILRDQSVFHCKTRDYDYKFSLPARELVKYGKTWYQRNLNAHIYHQQTLQDIQRYLSFINTKPDWNTFSHYPTADRLKPIWDKSSNYKELVLTLLKDIQRVYPDSIMDDDTNRNCHILHPWFNDISYEYLEDLSRVDNFILRDSFPFVQGLTAELIPENEVTRGRIGHSGGYNGWNDGGFWFVERIR